MANIRALLGVLVSLPLWACAAEPPEHAPESHALAAQAPALGKADGTDSADRTCSVVLREVSRVPASDGSYQQKCAGGACNWVFSGHVDVSRVAHPSNADVGVLYHLASDPTWWEVSAQAAPDGRPGFYSHTFELSEHLLGPNASDAELASARIELIPFVKLPNGGRLFDHNRKKSDFDVYSFGQADWFSVTEDQSCQPVAGTLLFQGDWQESMGGSLHAGGWLGIYYDLTRLPDCRATHNGYPAWDTLAYVKFSPGGQLETASVRDFVTVNGSPTNTAVSRQPELQIPSDATSVELWFENYSGAGNSCDTWDSNYGANYHYEILPPVDDPRCQDVESWTQIYAGQPTCTAYSLDQEVEATNCELYLTGFGHGYEGHYGIPFEWLEAYVGVGAQDGQLLNVGMLTRYLDPADGAIHGRFSLGTPVDGGSYKTGFTYHSTGMQSLPSYFYTVEEVAFFADVRRPSGQVVRLWQSRGGQNYSWNDAFGSGTTQSSIPYGNEVWAGNGAAVFDQKHACGK